VEEIEEGEFRNRPELVVTSLKEDLEVFPGRLGIAVE
jgi:hypothetical protein